MIYLALQSETQILSIPRASGRETARTGLVLRLCKGGAEKTFSSLNDLDVNGQYYLLEVEGADALKTGEYDYTLEGPDGDVYSTGILVAGNYVREIKDVPGGAKIIEYGGK